MATMALTPQLRLKKPRPGGGLPSPLALLLAFFSIMTILDSLADYTPDALLDIAMIFFLIVINQCEPKE